MRYHAVRSWAEPLPDPTTFPLTGEEWERAQQAMNDRARLAALSADVAFALTQPAELSDVLLRCTQAVVDRLDAAFARIWTLNTSTQVLELQASAGMYTHTNGPHGRVPVGTLKIGKIAEERKPHLTNQVIGDPRVGEQEWAKRERMVAFAGYPLLIHDELVGVLAMFSRRPLSEADFEGLGTVAQALALGIARHRSEAALQRQVHDLAQLAAALERSNRELDQFAYIASHDLKAPLRGIANLSQWIEEDLGPSISGTAREHLTLLRGRIHRMEGLIDGILEYSRAGRTRAAPERVNTRRLVADVVELLAIPADVDLDIVEPMPVVTTERLPLQQVLQNLIGNAVKHAGRKDPSIRIAAAADAGGVTFTVTDNGPGIEPAYHERVWGIFQTLQPRDKVEGAGIGLAIVKKTVEARGGRVWLDSAPGSGATFGFWWPCDTKGC